MLFIRWSSYIIVEWIEQQIWVFKTRLQVCQICTPGLTLAYTAYAPWFLFVVKAHCLRKTEKAQKLVCFDLPPPPACAVALESKRVNFWPPAAVYATHLCLVYISSESGAWIHDFWIRCLNKYSLIDPGYLWFCNSLKYLAIYPSFLLIRTIPSVKIEQRSIDHQYLCDHFFFYHFFLQPCLLSFALGEEDTK